MSFRTGDAPQHAASIVERVIVRHDEPGHDGFAEAPGRFDDAFVGAVQRVPGEHHARAVGLDHPLHDHADAWCFVEAERPPVRACRFGMRGFAHLENRLGDVIFVPDVEDRHVLAGEAAPAPNLPQSPRSGPRTALPAR